MDSLSFGTLSSSGTSPRLSGTASSLDTEAIVNAAYEAKRLAAVRLETKITTNEAKLTAFADMRSLLENLKNAALPLRSPPGILGAKDNVFETKAAFFSSSSSTNPTDLLGISVDNNAQTGSFEVEVVSLATANKLASSSTTSAEQTLADAWNGGVAFSGSLEIGLAGGDSASISVDGTMDIYGLSVAINAESSTTGVRASVLKVSDTDYRLVLNAEETGKAISITDTSGITGGFVTTELQPAQQAELQIDGVTVFRDTNQIDDLTDGLTINLFKAEPGTTVSVSVESSLGDIKEQIGAFVEAYNTFRAFFDAQSTVGPTGEIAEEAFLYGDRTMRDFMQGMSAIAGDAVAGLDAGALSTLRGIGITLDANNQLEVDDGKLDNALLTDIDEVRAVFEFGFQANSDELAVFERTNALADTSFTVDITDADNDGIPEQVLIDGVEADISGSTIRGKDGTDHEGLELLWAGTGSTSIEVGVSQGIADKLFNFLDENLDPFEGSLQTAIDGLEDQNESYTVQIARIDERAERARDHLVERFAAMEAALSIANTLLSQIRTQVDAMTASN